MKNPLVWLAGILLLLWLFLGSFLSGRYCNCANAAAAPALLTPAVSGSNKADKSILIEDPTLNFKSAANDNLLFPNSSCEYLTPLAEPLTTVFRESADFLKNNPKRILVLTGLYLGSESNQCSGEKDLGFGRATRVKQLLVGMGAPAGQIRVQSDKRDVQLYDGKVLGGVQYEFISGDIGDVENRLRIGNITLYFDTNEKEINLSPEQQKYFEDLKFFLSQKPEARISVTGHTDNRSNRKYNLRLSRKRAEFVQDYMIQNGIPLKQMNTIGKGPDEPIATNDTEEGRAKNRRVEVKIQ